MKTLVLAALALSIATPALAEKADTRLASVETKPLCEIWASVTAPNFQALIEHEMAHCWGWVHPIHDTPLDAKTDAERKAYRAAIPPLRYRILGEYPNSAIYSVSEKDAAKECGSWGCASGGLMPD